MLAQRLGLRVSQLGASLSSPLFAAGTGWWLRRASRRQVDRELARHRGVFAAVLSLAEEHRAPDAVPMRARIELAAPTTDETTDEPRTDERALRKVT